MTSAGKSYRVAVFGASSLHGKELKDVLEAAAFPLADIRLLDDEAADGLLTEAGGEPVVIRSVGEDSFEGVHLAFFAGEARFAGQHWQAARRAGATVVDLSGALSSSGDSVAWIPGLDAVLAPPVPPSGEVFLSPPAATIIACTIAAALAPLAPRRLAIVFFQPVSECGPAGIQELESQTVSLLSFQPIVRETYDAQVAFNLLGRYGAASEKSLAEARDVIAQQVSRYLAGRVPMPAIQLVQAPVFYSYAFTAFLEAGRPREVDQVEKALRAAGVVVGNSTDEAPSNVSVAGQNEVTLAAIERDTNLENSFWLWGAADNVRLAARNAVAIAEKILVH